MPLDTSHKELIEELGGWNADCHLLVTTTTALQDRESVGVFHTVGGDCVLFPLLDGAWKVYRTELKVPESPIWIQDSKGWVSCYYNRPPDLREACLANGGIEDPDKKGGFALTASGARKAAKMLGLTIDFPEGKQITLKPHKDGRLIISIPKTKKEPVVPGWLPKTDRITRVFTTRVVRKEEESDEYANIRAVITTADKFEGWYKRDGDSWVEEPPQNIKMLLQSLGHSKTESEEVMGGGISKEWETVCLPFQPEYPGGRQWNRRAAQLRYKPADLDGEAIHPYWDIIYNHVGQELTPALENLQWAIDAGIKTGGDYLRAWTASVLRYPFDQLPYLFLHGDEESGKSIFWESMEVLMTRGVVRADKALTSQSGFNGELVGAVICAVDEIDLSKHPGAMAKVRDTCTGKTLSIRKMRTDTFDIPNTTHWIQAGNNLTMCPVPDRDTRVTFCHVPLPSEDIPKHFFFDKLHEEAPHFLFTLLTLPLPPVIKRLRLPIVVTDSKRELASRNALGQFIQEEYEYDPSVDILGDDLRDHFRQYCDDEGLENEWTNAARFGEALLKIGDGRITKIRKRVGSARLHFYKGIKEQQ